MLADLYRYRRYASLRVAGSFLVRIHPFLQTVTFVIPVVAQIVFWRAVYAGGASDIGGFSASDTILYLVVIRLVADLTWAHIGGIREQILFGELTDYLLKPTSYMVVKYFEHVGTMATRWMNAVILAFIIYLFFSAEVHPKADLWAYPAGLFSVVLTFHLEHVFRLCVAFLSFWGEGRPPLLGHIAKLFSGSLVPLTFLPDVFQSLSDVLPFKYMLYFPTTVFLGKVSPEAFVSGMLAQLLWIAGLTLLARLMWRKGVKRYVAYGG